MQELAILAKTIIAELREINNEENARVAYFFEELRTIEAELEGALDILMQPSGEPDRESSGPERVLDYYRNFIQVALFSSAFNVEWFTVR